VTALLENAGAVNKHLMAYPNSGEVWIASEHRWTGESCDAIEAIQLYDAGARMIGGCCRTTPDDIARMRAELFAHLE